MLHFIVPRLWGSETDQAQFDEAAKTSKARVIGGAAAVGVGVVGGIVGDLLINGTKDKKTDSGTSTEDEVESATLTALKQCLKDAGARKTEELSFETFDPSMLALNNINCGTDLTKAKNEIDQNLFVDTNDPDQICNKLTSSFGVEAATKMLNNCVNPQPQARDDVNNDRPVSTEENIIPSDNSDNPKMLKNVVEQDAEKIRLTPAVLGAEIYIRGYGKGQLQSGYRYSSNLENAYNEFAMKCEKSGTGRMLKILGDNSDDSAWDNSPELDGEHILTSLEPRKLATCVCDNNHEQISNNCVPKQKGQPTTYPIDEHNEKNVSVDSEEIATIKLDEETLEKLQEKSEFEDFDSVSVDYGVLTDDNKKVPVGTGDSDEVTISSDQEETGTDANQDVTYQQPEATCGVVGKKECNSNYYVCASDSDCTSDKLPPNATAGHCWKSGKRSVCTATDCKDDYTVSQGHCVKSPTNSSSSSSATSSSSSSSSSKSNNSSSNSTTSTKSSSSNANKKYDFLVKGYNADGSCDIQQGLTGQRRSNVALSWCNDLKKGDWKFRYESSPQTDAEIIDHGTSVCAQNHADKKYTSGTPKGTTGGYCWCKLVYETSMFGEKSKKLSKSWIYIGNHGLSNDCAGNCAFNCAYEYGWTTEAYKAMTK